MKQPDVKKFHALYGEKKVRMAFNKKDYVDYLIMTSTTLVLVFIIYGDQNPLSLIGFLMGMILCISFPYRHGFKIAMPLILRRPIDIFYMVIYKVRNVKPMYVFSICTCVLQVLLIELTPNLPHFTEEFRTVSFYLFYGHIAFLTLYRTIILIAHLGQAAHVKAFLMQTTWSAFVTTKSNVYLELIHAYATGLLSHVVLIAPFYLVICYVDFSVLFLPVMCALNFFTHLRYLKSYNAWFYRDHWLGHNSEFEFLYLHGTHHDAIPTGLIGVSGNGHLEGFFRHTFGHPTPFYNPVFATLLYSMEVFLDMKNHQYVPGVFPELPRSFHEVCQHSTHHFGRLEPYSVAVRVVQKTAAHSDKRGFQLIPPEIQNSIALDEQLDGFKWENRKYLQFLELFDKYQR